MSNHPPHKNYCQYYVGFDAEIPLLDGGKRRYINFDNAASTPSLQSVQKAVNDFLVYYSSVHRGTGFKSQLSTRVYEQAREIVLDFVGADTQEHTCIFGKNATEAINKLAQRFPFTNQRDIVLTSSMEHHSNDLPWRAATETIHVAVTPNGQLDEADFDTKLEQYANRVALVAITGASNVTGFINPVHKLAQKTHAAGAQIAVDCAQFAPHRKIDMRPLSDPSHLDYVSISAHKMYAPFGTGALIGRQDTFECGRPNLVGGGTVKLVTTDDVTWADVPERDEAGSPNVVGAVALAAAIRQLEDFGMDAIARHEAELTNHILQRLLEMPDIDIYGDSDSARASERLGVVPINMKGKHHFLVAAILGYEFGIGVRNGCFCAHPYILDLLDLTPHEAEIARERVRADDRSDIPGLVRISFGLYNTISEVDVLIAALEKIARGDYVGDYRQNIATGEFHPRGWKPNFGQYFKL
ncbi:MAG: aminotransferase class V-fold PLP-dependent enzyme [Chloroflexota bacterium]|nr:aminotransferase class V-fold PLP-dependent enzyme [Chloroflexota bacterium]